MSDLKFILDTGDDEDHHHDKYSRQSSFSGPARSPNPSLTAKTTIDGNHPSSDVNPDNPQLGRRGLLSRSPSRSTQVATRVDKASPSRSPLAERRRSVDSIESMDSTHYGTYASRPSSSANMPPSGRSHVSSRPMSSTTGESTMPIRLTPVTRRPSRAKKGVPVHTCDICKPPKTFTRAEHLRRHQLSHKPPSYQCSYMNCGKAFHRQDLLTRHTEKHNEKDDGRGGDMDAGPSRRKSNSPSERNPSINLMPPSMPRSNSSMVDGMSPSTSYPGSASPYPPSNHGSLPGQGQMSPSYSPRSYSTGPSQAQEEYLLAPSPHHRVGSGYQTPSMDNSLMYPNPYNGAYEPRRSPHFNFMVLDDLEIPDGTYTTQASQDSAWPSSASNSPYSIPDGAVIRGFDSPSADLTQSEGFYIPRQYHSPHQHIYATGPDFTTPSYPEDTNNFYEIHAQPFSVRSPTPPIVTLSAQPAEHLVTLGSSMPEPTALLSRHQKGVSGLLSPYPDTAFSTAPGLSAALRAIPRYLDVYWKRFDPLFPLVHRRSLETSADPVLKYAVAALGSQFLQSKEDRTNSHILHGLALQEAGHHVQWTNDTMQTILLCEFYGRFRGSRAMARASQPFQSLYSRMATPHTSADLDTLITNNNSTNPSHRHWKEWIDAESRRRLLAACFVLDIHTSMYHEHSPLHHFSTSTPPIPLTSATQHLWAAPTPEVWEDLLSTASPGQLDAPMTLADAEITADRVRAATPLDRAMYLASEALQLRRRRLSSLPTPTSAVDPAMDVDHHSDTDDATRRLRDLFPGSAVANTYLALHHTPLRDLLAVSGDSWVFSRKLLDPEDFQRRRQSVRSWSAGPRALAAAAFAARALLAFLDDTYSTTTTVHDNEATIEEEDEGLEEDDDEDDEEEEDDDDLMERSTGRRRSQHQQDATTTTDWNHFSSSWSWSSSPSSDISDSWALYICALICWSISHRSTRAMGGRGVVNDPKANNGKKAESEARAWLRMMAAADDEAAVRNVMGRRAGSLSVVAVVRRRLEAVTAGGKSKLLVDAVRVLKTLEEDPNRGRF